MYSIHTYYFNYYYYTIIRNNFNYNINNNLIYHVTQHKIVIVIDTLIDKQRLDNNMQQDTITSTKEKFERHEKKI